MLPNNTMMMKVTAKNCKDRILLDFALSGFYF